MFSRRRPLHHHLVEPPLLPWPSRHPPGRRPPRRSRPSSCRFASRSPRGSPSSSRAYGAKMLKLPRCACSSPRNRDGPDLLLVPNNDPGVPLLPLPLDLDVQPVRVVLPKDAEAARPGSTRTRCRAWRRSDEHNSYNRGSSTTWPDRGRNNGGASSLAKAKGRERRSLVPSLSLSTQRAALAALRLRRP